MPRADPSQRRKELHAASLSGIINGLLAEQPALHQGVKRHLSPPQEEQSMVEDIQQRLSRLAEDEHFIDDRQAQGLARQLSALLTDIEQLGNGDLPAAILCLETLIDCDRPLLDRVDDNSGRISQCFHDACEQWLSSCAQLRESQPTAMHWSDRLAKLVADDSYGLRTSLLRRAGQLLSTDEMKRMVWQEKNRIRNAKRAGASDAFQLSATAARLAALAEALHDAPLLERALKLQNQAPNARQRLNLAQHYLQKKQPEKALPLLVKSVDPDQEEQRLQLLIRCHEQQNNEAARLACLQQRFALCADLASLQDWLSQLPAAQRDSQWALLESKARQAPDPTNGARELLRLERFEAAALLLIARRAELSNCHYAKLRELAESLTDPAPLGAVACYRGLLEQLFSRPEPQLEQYALRYYQQLLSLDKELADYAPQENHHQWQQQQRSRWPTRIRLWQQLTLPQVSGAWSA